MNGSHPPKNLDANGIGKRLGQTAKNVRGRGNANANKESERVWTAKGITSSTSCNNNSNKDTNSSNLTDPHPHNNSTIHTITTITSSITITKCRRPHNPRIITPNPGTSVRGEYREIWNTAGRDRILHCLPR